MKIGMIRILSQVSDIRFRNILSDFISQTGMIKRDFIQNKSDHFKDDVPMPTWNCTKFVLNRISKKSNINILEIEDLASIGSNDEQKIYYDLEICEENKEQTILCALLLYTQHDLLLVIIDILNTGIFLINSKDIYRADLGPKIYPYKESSKIYSIIYNALIFKQHKEYIEHKQAYIFNKKFRPLYEKIYIQSGYIV